MNNPTGQALLRDSGQKSAATTRAIKKVGLFSFVFVMYSYNTAGPFGLEDQVRTSGPGMALIYQLLIPFFWCIPISLVAAELTTAMPVEGGFYRWTRAAFGDFWGFLAGWWNWCASFLLGALYAVLFTDYLAFYFPQLTGWRHFLVAVSVIAVIAYVNVRGIRLVGRIATILELGILAVVLVMCAMSVRMWHFNPFLPVVPPHKPVFQVFGVGLALGLWLYAGYEQVSSVAEEVEDPQRNVLVADGVCAGCVGRLGEVEHWIFFSGGHTHRRPCAGLRHNCCRRGDELIDSQQHNPDHNTNAVLDG